MIYTVRIYVNDKQFPNIPIRECEKKELNIDRKKNAKFRIWRVEKLCMIYYGTTIMTALSDW